MNQIYMEIRDMETVSTLSLIERGMREDIMCKYK